MKAITLINPRGERLELTNVEFYELQLQFANSKTFEQWSEKRRISGWIGKGDDIRLSISAVNKFLREKGYNIIFYCHRSFQNSHTITQRTENSFTPILIPGCHF